MRVQRNATGALLNMTHSGSFNFRNTHLDPVEETHVPLIPGENRQQLVDVCAIPVLVGLLTSPDTDVQYRCTAALSNIAVDDPSAIFLGIMAESTDEARFGLRQAQTGKNWHKMNQSW